MTRRGPWTIPSLKDYFDQRFVDQDKAVQAALLSADKAVQAALQAAKEAVNKAEIAAEKRFDAVNEFRGQLADQAATFMPRAEAEIRLSNINDRLAANTSSLDRSGGGTQTSQRYMATVIAALASLASIVALIVVLVHG